MDTISVLSSVIKNTIEKKLSSNKYLDTKLKNIVKNQNLKLVE